MNRHTKHFILFSLARAINLPMLFLNSALIGRILGASGFGQWSMIIAASTMIHNVFFNWTYASGLRFGCEEWLKNGALSRTWAARLPLLLIGLLIALFLLIFQPFNWLSLLFSTQGNLWWLVLVFSMSLWITNELRITLQATDQMSLLALASPMITVFFTIFLFLLFLNPRGNNMSVWVVIGQIVITFIICIGIWFRSQKKWLFSWRFPDQGDVKRHLRFGWTLLPTFLASYITMWGNYSILQAYHSSREVGLFGAAYQIVLGIISLNSILITILLPRLIAKNAESKDACKNFFNNIVPTLFCLWSLVTIALIAIIPSIFLILFGKQFIDSQPMLIILFIVIPTSILPHEYTILLNTQQRLSREFLYSFVGMVASLIVSFSLIPTMGGIGAAIGTASALLITQLLSMWDQHRFINAPLRRMGILFSATLVFCIFQYIIGLNLCVRLIWSAASICFLILLFRKLRIINSNLLSTIFSGHLLPVGMLLKRLLVVKS